MQENQTTLNSNRNLWIDIAKGILIILMVAGHAGVPTWLESMIYTFHMPCFFIISGFLFSEAYLSDPKKFIIKRGKRLWWPFVMWTWIFILLHNIFYSIGLYNSSYTLSDTFKSLINSTFMLHVESLLGGFWFLASLLIATLVSFFYFKFFGTKVKTILIGISLFIVGAETLSVINFGFAHFNQLNFMATAYFMTGMLFKKITIKKRKFDPAIIGMGIVLIGISGFYGKIQMLGIDAKLLMPYFFQSIVISYAFMLILYNFQGKNWVKFFCYFGSKTIDILIIHFLAFKAISLLKIRVLGMDYNHLSDFPVIKEQNEYFWVVYIAGALILSLLFIYTKEYIKKTIKGVSSLYFSEN